MDSIAPMAARLLNAPLFMEPSRLQSSIQTMLSVSATDPVEALVPSCLSSMASMGSEVRRGDGYYEHSGIAVISISGTLLHKYNWLGSWACGYNAIICAVKNAMLDPQVHTVLLDMDSPGGQVAGLFDCVNALRLLKALYGKPLISLCYDLHASAAMGIASAADTRLITQTGEAGSVGVIMAHYSEEKYLEDIGVKVTLIYAGKHKADGNPYENLPDDVYQAFLEETKTLRQEFAQLIAEGLSISAEQVLATEAKVYRGQDAIDAGLCDAIVNGNNVIQHIQENNLSAQGRNLSLGATMTTDNSSTNTNSSAQAAAAQQATEQATEQAATAAAAAQQAAEAQAPKVSAADERLRIAGILNADEAKDKQALANQLAFSSDMTVEAAIGILAVAAKEPSAAGATLDAVMDAEGNPVVTADDESAATLTGEKASVSIMSNYRKATGGAKKTS